MKLFLSLLMAFALATCAIAQQNTTGGSQQGAARQPASPRGQASFQFADGKTITVDYGRPYMRGRKIMGGLVPFGQVWRTGANAATGFETTAALTFGGKPLAAGKYTMYTLPGENQWTIIINGQTGQWGTEYDQSKDVLRVTASPTKTANAVDQFTISFQKQGQNSGIMRLEWENTRVEVPFSEQKQ